MIKYSFILLSGETEGFLEKIQELGVVDVTRSVKPIDDYSASVLNSVGHAKAIVEKLEGIDYSKEEDKKAIERAYAKTVIEKDMVAGAAKALAELKDLETEKDAAEKEVKARRPWGDFDRARLEQLESLGYVIRYYMTSKKKFDQGWAELYPLEVIHEDAETVWFVTVSHKDQEYSLPLEQTQGPAASWKEAQARVDALKEKIATTKGAILRYKENIGQMTKNYEGELAQLDLYLAKASCESAAENALSIVVGFAPVENEDKLTMAFNAAGVFYFKEDATVDDNPPIRLKNNWFARQFEVFTGMYGMPVYNEFDPTSVLAPFYLLFFAMCMGDAGYGIVLMLFGLALNRGWVKIGMFEGLGNIITVLGVGTTVVGAALGTFFGMPILDIIGHNVYHHTFVDGTWQVYNESICPAVSSYYEFVGSNIATPMGALPFQMLLALGIGIFHICLAMVIKAVGYTQRLGFKENIATWGWVLLIVGGLIVALLGVGSILSAAAIKWAVIAIAVVSALAIYIFNTPGRNPLVNMGAGLWDTYNMATGILGDVLSYIRLFALGLAGGMLGAAFNDLALMVKGDNIATWIPFILILLFGHTLNVLMSALGSFVHPLRLTFVEYFKNAGYEGKGSKYNPLKK